MSARTVVMPPRRQSAKEAVGVSGLLAAGSTPAGLLSAEFGTDPVSALRDSEAYYDELVRRFEAAYPLPWPHGGLNE
jgi:hypothetical protein